MSGLEDVRAETDRCTSCGLCLASCPTFAETRAEGDSPRGRVHLLRLADLNLDRDPVARDHLAGCIECGACHDPCPTGVRVATAVSLHRHALRTPPSAHSGPDAAALRELLARDPGAALAVEAARDLRPGDPRPGDPRPGDPRTGDLRPGDGSGHRPVPAGTRQRGDGSDPVLPVPGLLLRRAAPSLVAELDRRLGGPAPGSTGADLVHALERSAGLLRDVGRYDEHERAVDDVLRRLGRYPGGPATVLTLDLSLGRLRDLPWPPGWRVLPAYDWFDLAPPRDVPGDAVREHGVPGVGWPGRLAGLPAEHAAAGAPVLPARPALATLGRLVAAQRDWLAGRTLVTWDARSLPRYRNTIHLASFLVPERRSRA
ncbi:(Fe-S)-binding protein [Plantactinospora sp. KBS50]|uniref:(Fe-S)-binding protein n=1 Tax=Plantactinospora sp. KBS50 TaxID=2024580 RepID=UPI0018DFEEBC|nr:(Fe-S)-binding protein [Plantactinospora sp. KBS50]